VYYLTIKQSVLNRDLIKIKLHIALNLEEWSFMKKLFLSLFLALGINFQSLLPMNSLFSEETVKNVVLSVEENRIETSEALSIFNCCFEGDVNNRNFQLSRSSLERMIELGQNRYPDNYFTHTHQVMPPFNFLCSFNKILKDFNFRREDLVAVFAQYFSDRRGLEFFIDRFKFEIMNKKRKELITVIRDALLPIPSAEGFNVADELTFSALSSLSNLIEGDSSKIDFILTKYDLERMLKLSIESFLSSAPYHLMLSPNELSTRLSLVNRILRIYNFNKEDLIDVLAPYFSNIEPLIDLVTEFKNRIMDEKVAIVEQLMNEHLTVDFLSVEPNETEIPRLMLMQLGDSSRVLTKYQIEDEINKMIYTLSCAPFFPISFIESRVVSNFKIFNKILRIYNFDSRELCSICSKYCKEYSRGLIPLYVNRLNRVKLNGGISGDSSPAISVPSSPAPREDYVIERSKMIFAQQREKVEREEVARLRLIQCGGGEAAEQQDF